VPTLVDRDLVLYDTGVICEYLDERYPHPPLMPVDPLSRARLRLAIVRIENDWVTLVEQIEDGGKTKRTYDCPAIKLTPRHRAQDITGDLGETTPETLTAAAFTFSVDITTAENKGEISASDCSNGRYEASYTHTVGDGSVITEPAVSGSKVVSAPVSKNMPENGYVEYTYAINGTLTGKEAAA
jgi:hypothetical protein